MIEAGLGGRYDATNVIPSKVQVLTSVGLEHTRWLGPTLTDIAAEKLDVVQEGATLVLGHGLDPEVLERVADRVAAERHARIVQAGLDPGVAVGAAGLFQRRNFALARAAAEAYLGELDERAVAAAAAEVRVPGRLQEVAQSPLTLLDGAHNPDGMRALAESLPELVAGHDRVVAVVSILDDKDAAGMLAPVAARVRCGRLHEQSKSAGIAATDVAVSRHPARRSSGRDRAGAAARAGPRARAGRPGRRCHCHRFDLPDRRSAGAAGPRTGLKLVNERRDQPSFLAMMGLVALVVAIVILVFFGIGYLFGRAFL